MKEGSAIISKVASIEENSKKNTKKRSGSNFDDDENWDVEIKDLIIDLDADIEKDSSPKGIKSVHSRQQSMPDSKSTINHNSPSKGTTTVLMPQTTSAKTATSSSTESSSSCLKMKIKRKNVVGSRSSEVKHEVVLATEDAKALKKHDNKSSHSNGNTNVITSNNGSSNGSTS